MWTVHAVSLITTSAWYRVKEEDDIRKQIKKWITENQGMTAGLLITAVTSFIIEGIARIVSAILWTYNIKSSTLAVWLPQGIITANTLLLILCHIICGYCKCKKCGDNNCTPLWPLHIILPLHFVLFGLLYFLFPAIILVLAYPTQMIATLTFVLSYLFATTIFSAILFNICRDYIEPPIYDRIQRFNARRRSAEKDKPAKQPHAAKPSKPGPAESLQADESPQANKLETANVCSKICAYGGPLILFWILMLYIHYIAILFLYSLLIGRGSAISTGPLAVISIFPSIIVSGIALIVKRFTLNGPT